MMIFRRQGAGEYHEVGPAKQRFEVDLPQAGFNAESRGHGGDIVAKQRHAHGVESGRSRPADAADADDPRDLAAKGLSPDLQPFTAVDRRVEDRKSTRLNSSH